MPSMFKPNPLFGLQICQSAVVVAAVKAGADEIAEVARSLAPARSQSYRDSIGVTMAVEKGRPVARVGAKDFKAVWIEYGSSGSRWGGKRPGTARTAATPAFAPLGRAAAQVFGKVEGGRSGSSSGSSGSFV